MPEITSIGELREGQLVQGYVRQTNEKGCFVALSRSVVARVLIAQLRYCIIRTQKNTSFYFTTKLHFIEKSTCSPACRSDSFIRAPAQAFPAGRLVTARVLSVDAAAQRVELALKRSVLRKTKHYLLADIKPVSLRMCVVISQCCLRLFL